MFLTLVALCLIAAVVIGATVRLVVTDDRGPVRTVGDYDTRRPHL